MSISLPNGTILAAPSQSQSQVSAAVTRILHLSKFSPELKTRDLQAIFKDWENEKGGFRIKWLDDVNALVVFADATTAKRAYLHLLLNTPPTFPPPAQIRPYDRPDAAQIIASLAARNMGHRSGMSTTMNESISRPADHQAPSSQLHSRASSSIGGMNGFQMPLKATHRSTPSRDANGSMHGRIGHSRTGSASSSWARGSGPGAMGALNFSNFPTSSSAPKLPTHSEGSTPLSTGSDDTEAVVIMDSAEPRTGTKVPGPLSTQNGNQNYGGQAGNGLAGRRDSISAEKAMREVEKALASVETQG